MNPTNLGTTELTDLHNAVLLHPNIRVRSTAGATPTIPLNILKQPTCWLRIAPYLFCNSPCHFSSLGTGQMELAGSLALQALVNRW